MLNVFEYIDIKHCLLRHGNEDSSIKWNERLSSSRTGKIEERLLDGSVMRSRTLENIGLRKMGRGFEMSESHSCQ